MPMLGGALAVRHGGHELIFDWNNTYPSKIAWAAFYNDCEHEVEEVRSGHRVTLTYNLYVTDRNALTLRQPSSIVDPSRMVLHGMLKETLLRPGFMTRGNNTPACCLPYFCLTQ